MNIIKTKSSKSIKTPVVFAHRGTESEIEISTGSTFAYESYRRNLAYINETSSVLFALYYLDGALTTETYNEQIQNLMKIKEDMDNSISLTRKNLVIVKNGQVINSLVFDDEIACDMYCKENLGFSANDIVSLGNIPLEYMGTKVFDLQHIDNTARVLSNLRGGV